MKTQVVSVCNREPRDNEPYYRLDLFIASLARFGVVPTILGMGEPWGGLMTKPRRLRQWLREGRCEADLLISSDAFDVVFGAHPDEVGKQYNAYPHWKNGVIVFNAEKGLFPRGDLEYAFPDGGTPWRYLNSGFFIGPPAQILRMLEAMSLDDIHDDWKSPDVLHGGVDTWVNTNDQGHYQYAYAAQPVPMALDEAAVLCQTGSACTLDEFDLTGERIQNIVTGTFPLVWHFNGGSKNDLLPAMIGKLGL